LEKCAEDDKVSGELDFENDIYTQNCVEGALMRLFNYNNEWIVSTKKCINSSNSKWISPKSFFQLFLEAFPSFTNEKLETLNKNYCYSFILSHPENNIISKGGIPTLYHVSTRDMDTLKEITLKSKLAKTVPKQELAEQYDNYIAQKAVQAVTKQPKPKPRPDPEPKIESEESEEEETVIVKKPKKKIKKKIIFESESEDEETVVVQKKKPPPQKQPLEKLVYESNKDQLYQRMIEERVKNAVIGYGRALNGF
jgi:hypothetical protein